MTTPTRFSTATVVASSNAVDDVCVVASRRGPRSSVGSRCAPSSSWRYDRPDARVPELAAAPVRGAATVLMPDSPPFLGQQLDFAREVVAAGRVVLVPVERRAPGRQQHGVAGAARATRPCGPRGASTSRARPAPGRRRPPRPCRWPRRWRRPPAAAVRTSGAARDRATGHGRRRSARRARNPRARSPPRARSSPSSRRRSAHRRRRATNCTRCGRPVQPASVRATAGTSAPARNAAAAAASPLSMSWAAPDGGSGASAPSGPTSMPSATP